MNEARNVERRAGLRQFKPYPAYMDSGVEWLGEIPEPWEVKRLKLVAALNPKASEVRGLAPDTEVSFVPMEAVGEYGGLDLSSTKSLAEIAPGYTYFRDDDVVVAKITPCFENGKGAHAARLVNGIAFGTTELHVLRGTQALDYQFLFYLTISDAFRRLGEAQMYGAAGQKRVPESFVENLRHPLPSILEQRVIAAFLDQETAMIDALVAKKERLIELLQEKRTALIARAVTRGLDRNAPMKDSGVEWLGAIPAHWEVRPFKALLSRNDSGVWGEDFADEGTIVLRSTEQTVDGRWLIESPARRSLTASEAARSRLEVGDLVVTKSSGSELHIGKTSIVDESVAALDCGFSNFMQRLRVGREHQARFFWYLLNCPVAREQLVFLSSTTTGLGNLNGSVLGAIRTPAPPGEEQRAIVAFLDRKTSRIDALAPKVRDAIDRLKELRTALIAAAVTGKIDVREDAA